MQISKRIKNKKNSCKICAIRGKHEVKKAKIVNGSGKQREGNLKFKIIGFF